MEVMNFPYPTKFNISLKKTEPTKTNPESLKKELNAAGLTCEHTEVYNLKKYIEQTVRDFPTGSQQGFGIRTFKDLSELNCDRELYLKQGEGLFNAVTNNLGLSSNWEPTDYASIYLENLATVICPSHFDFLKDKYVGFGGNTKEESYTKLDTTVEHVKAQYVQLANSLSSAVVENIDREDMEAFLNKIIKEMPSEVENYDTGLNDRIIFLVKDYNEKTQECSGIGAICVRYRMIILSYKDKKGPKKQMCGIYMAVRSALYSSPEALQAQADWVKTQFKSQMFCSKEMPFPKKVKIFDALPAPNNMTFISSLPLEQTENDILEALVFYCPNVDNIGILDNTDSDGSSQYSKTVTSGFTFSMAEKIGAEASFEAGALFVKAGFKLSFDITFTEQWNKSQSETMMFNVPAGKKAYLYQGYVLSAILQMNVKTLEYKYKTKGRFLTNIVKSTAVPVA